MQIKIKKMMNKTTQIEITAEGENLEACVFQITPIINMPTSCGLCGQEAITIRTRVTKDKKKGDICLYTSYMCVSCQAEMLWHQYRQPKGCFYLNKWTEKYEANNENGGR